VFWRRWGGRRGGGTRATGQGAGSALDARTLAAVLYYDHRFMEAETECEEILKLDPYSYRNYTNLGKTYLSLGNTPKRGGRLRKHRGFRATTRWRTAVWLRRKPSRRRGRGQSHSGGSGKASPDELCVALSFAFALAGLGRLDEALVYLKKASTDRAGWLYIKVEPSFDALHGNRSSANWSATSR